MTQTSNRLFDELARLMTDAANVAQGVRREASTAFRTQMERLIADLDLVQREDFDVVREMASKARQENEVLAARVAALEAEARRLIRQNAEAGHDEPASAKKTPQNQGVRRAQPSRRSAEPANQIGDARFCEKTTIGLQRMVARQPLAPIY